ncbi:hypothetical protein JI752_015080 [Lysobacter sp. MMG2]|uniref:hypothetical protein n=1 Tax=Lysobacter sp. MMG2 TaxID=2801338 RepID=UPI001C24CBBC|nr:hypothetical protein [Lysobacter sp. MMG2]MBU8977472.1 hypothetical protein [Lysobacter sp. MMG2]
MAARYYIRLPDAKRARGADPSLSFTAVSAEGFAEQLEAALREPSLFERWKAKQDDPDAVEPSLGATDPNAVVRGEQDDLHIDLIATTGLPGELLRQRLRWLAGSAWELRDVTSA